MQVMLDGEKEKLKIKSD